MKRAAATLLLAGCSALTVIGCSTLTINVPASRLSDVPANQDAATGSEQPAPQARARLASSPSAAGVLHGGTRASSTRTAGVLRHGELLSGAARVDITPPPGYPMAGYSRIGRIARGQWLRLYSRALFFEDTGGSRLALVSNDLWGLPRGLHSRVAELLATDAELVALAGGRAVDRDEIVLAATHTHQSVGGYSTDRMFSTFSAVEEGFDHDVFEFLARRIATVIARAAAAARPATISVSSTRVDALFRNRSFDAFMHNPEAAAVLEQNNDLSPCDEKGYAPDACRAVDPTVRVLRVTPAEGGVPIAMAVFLAAHPTVIHHRSPLYSSDVFGAVALQAERKLHSPDAESRPVVAVFNGAEGDISFRWRMQNRAELMRLADLLGRVVIRLATSPVHAAGDVDLLTALQAGGRDASPTVSSAFDLFSLAHRRVRAHDGRWRRTARIALPGRGTIAGAEDGRTDVPKWISHEGKRGIDLGAHGSKIGAFDLAEIGGFVIPPLWPSRVAALLLPPEREVAVSVHRLGPLVLATLPGEFTTTLGRRIRNAVASAAGRSREDVALIGLAQSYGYYFATAEEYGEQHYEGSGTLWGENAGSLLEARLSALAARPSEPHRRATRVEHYRPGWSRSFGGRQWIKKHADAFKDDLTYVIGRDSSHTPRWCWLEAVPQLDEVSTSAERVTPRVEIEALFRAGWKSLDKDGVAEDDEGLNLVTVAGKSRHGELCWCAYWLMPPNVDPEARYRFAVARAGQPQPCNPATDCSPAFSPSGSLPAHACPRAGR